MSESRNESHVSSSTRIGLANRGIGTVNRPSIPMAPAVARAPESLLKVVWRSRWIMFLGLVLALDITVVVLVNHQVYLVMNLVVGVELPTFELLLTI